MFSGKKILITGGTGSLGSSLTKKLLKTDVETIRIFSRDEWKQTQMSSEIKDDRLRFLIGDIRDKERLYRAVEDIDIVFHTAALKHVPIAEYNPFEFIKTNVYGSQNVIDACLDKNVEIAIGIGTDKASSPINTYGATKLLMERQFISANHYRGNKKSKFICVRYGNVLGSRGSIVPKFIEQIKMHNEITVTDTSMTRFNITMKEAIELILRAVQNGKGGEVFVPKLKSYSVENMKNAIIELSGKKVKIRKIPVREGEKFHEMLISKEELRNVYETDKDYVIKNLVQKNERFENYKKLKLNDDYSSFNADRLSKEKLKEIIIKEKFYEKI